MYVTLLCGRMTAKFKCFSLSITKKVKALAYFGTMFMSFISWGRTKQDVTAGFGAIERESTKMGLWQLMRAEQSLCFRQAETCGVLILG